MSRLASKGGKEKEKGPVKPSGKEMFLGHMAGTEGGEADEEDEEDGKSMAVLSSPCLLLVLAYAYAAHQTHNDVSVRFCFACMSNPP